MDLLSAAEGDVHGGEDGSGELNVQQKDRHNG